MRAPRIAILVGVSIAMCLARLNSPARADIVHLKNGGIITADTWEVSGDRLIIRQGSGRITVPRSEVVRIEPSPRASPTPDGAPAAVQDGGSTGASVPAGGAAEPSEDQILRAVDDLKRRINGSSLARPENTRRL